MLLHCVVFFTLNDFIIHPTLKAQVNPRIQSPPPIPPKQPKKTSRLKQGRIGSQKGRHFTTPAGQKTQVTNFLEQH